ncbi:hypothetical protein TI39_contig4156g00006 [Zymoseptoria brevis]|uniref:Uncharacterized protein n=1 Tax=Zymoseptoria brevis TaxID=1047168 RepID=A0A0F4GBQ5_9PEZI|nr:hypothetical protein TI39_contig4156g00006 [Zymoseptoria brevis]
MTPNGPFCGTAIVISSDGEDLGSDAILRVTVDFLTTFWNLVLTMTMPEGDEKHTAKEKAVHVLSKEAFHAYFEERRRLAIAEGRPFRGKPKSSVLLKYPNVASACCGGCCAVSSSTVKLSKCGKLYLQALLLQGVSEGGLDHTQEGLQGEALRE